VNITEAKQAFMKVHGEKILKKKKVAVASLQPPRANVRERNKILSKS